VGAAVARASRNSRRLGRITLLPCLLLLLSLADLLQSSARQQGQDVRLIPGRPQPAAALLQLDKPATADLRRHLVADTRETDWKLEVHDISTDYWLGRPQWRGTVDVAPGTPPGRRTLILEEEGLDGRSERARLEVQVLASEEDDRRTHPAFSMRILGLSPQLLMIFSLVALGLCTGGLIQAGRKRRHLLLEAGLVEVYQATRVDGGLQLTFDPAHTSRLTPGQTRVVSELGEVLGTLTRIDSGLATVKDVVTPPPPPPYLLHTGLRLPESRSGSR
jgi:hypothetical protein